MNKKETSILEDYIRRSEEKEERRRVLRNRIVKSLERIEREMYDDSDSSNKGLLSRVNSLEEAIKEIGSLVKRTKMRNEVILGIVGTITLAVLTQLLNHFLKIF